MSTKKRSRKRPFFQSKMNKSNTLDKIISIHLINTRHYLVEEVGEEEEEDKSLNLITKNKMSKLIGRFATASYQKKLV